MQRSLAIASLLLLGGTSAAYADPVFDFSISGGGYSLQFSTANPPAVVEYPQGATDVSVTSLSGSVNGVSGYTFGAVLVAQGSYYPNFTLDVSPLPPGVSGPPQTQLGDFSLDGPDVLTLVSDQPNPVPCTIFCPDDLLTFAFVPGTYTFYGYGPTSGPPGYYTVDITQQASAVTPEPETWVLLLTGSAGLVAALWRRGTRRTGRPLTVAT